MKRLFLTAIIALCACQNSERDAISVLCNASVPKELKEATPENRARLMVYYLDAEASNEEVKTLIQRSHFWGPVDREKKLRDAMKKNAITTCPNLMGWKWQYNKEGWKTADEGSSGKTKIPPGIERCSLQNLIPNFAAFFSTIIENNAALLVPVSNAVYS